jgi:hypothetical protein
MAKNKGPGIIPGPLFLPPAEKTLKQFIEDLRLIYKLRFLMSVH